MSRRPAQQAGNRPRRRQFRRSRKSGFLATLASVVIFGAFVGLKFDDASKQLGVGSIDRSQERYFAYCDEARVAGVAPMYRNDPGYRAGLDGDGDGIACEPYYER